MNENTKLYSEMERFEIINYNDGEKYGYLGNNDIIIDENGNLKLLIINDIKAKFSFFKGNSFTEVPWGEGVKKIGPKTVIIDVDLEALKRAKV